MKNGKLSKLNKFVQVALLVTGLGISAATATTATSCVMPNDIIIKQPEIVCAECGEKHLTGEHQQIDISDVTPINATTDIKVLYEYINKLKSGIEGRALKTYKVFNKSFIPDGDLKYNLSRSFSNLGTTYFPMFVEGFVSHYTEETAPLIANILKNIPDEIERDKFMAAFNVISADQYLEFFVQDGVINEDEQSKTATFKELPALKQQAQDLGMIEGEEKAEIYRILDNVSATTGISVHVLREMVRFAIEVNASFHSLLDYLYTLIEVPTYRPSVDTEGFVREVPNRTSDYLNDKIFEILVELGKQSKTSNDTTK